MDKSAIIIAVDSQGNFAEDKALLKLDNKPLLCHAFSRVKGIVEEVIVVAASRQQADAYRKILPSDVQFVVMADSASGALAAALAGFEAAQGDYSVVLPFDSPFVSKEVVSFLFELSAGKSAVVPRWTSLECEPMHAVYNTGLAAEAARKALQVGEVDMAAVPACLRGVRYVSTMVIEQLDPDFRSFFRVRTPLDLKKAAVMAKPRKRL